MAEDLLQSALAFNRAQSLYAIPEILYWYRMDTGSVSHCYRPSYLEDRLVVFSEIAYLADTWGTGLRPIVYGQFCRHVLGHCVTYLNATHGESLESRLELVAGVAQREEFQQMYSGANLSCMHLWQRIGVRLLGTGHSLLLVLYIDVLFGLMTRIAPAKVTGYMVPIK